MFGILRTLWAVMVVVGHLFWISDFGRYAVFGFFVLSGFLMTLIMHKSYGYTKSGRLRFALNRLLRLFPIYWAACLFTIILVVWLGADATTILDKRLAIPDNFLEVFANLTMIFPLFMPNRFEPILSPAAWALTTELIYYFLIAFGISRTKKYCLIWLAISLAYILATYIADLYWHSRYFAIPAASLPFCMGSLIYHYSTNIQIICDKYFSGRYKLLAITAALIFIQIGIAVYGSMNAEQEKFITADITFYLNLVICGLLIAIHAVSSNYLPDKLQKLDKIIGNYSYPIYLIHWQVGLLVSVLLFGEVTILKQNFNMVAVALCSILIVAFSTLLITSIDKNIDKIRSKIRNYANQ